MSFKGCVASLHGLTYGFMMKIMFHDHRRCAYLKFKHYVWLYVSLCIDVHGDQLTLFFTYQVYGCTLPQCTIVYPSIHTIFCVMNKVIILPPYWLRMRMHFWCAYKYRTLKTWHVYIIQSNNKERPKCL